MSRDATEIVYDNRWNGPHGIGRFLANIATRIPMTPIGLSGAPTSAAGLVHIAIRLRQFKQCRLFFSPGYMPPWPGSPVPYVLTLHDLNHIDLDHNSSIAKRAFYRHVLRPACRRASAILTVSEFSRARILDWTGLPGDVVHNVGNGVADIYCAAGAAFACDAPYFLTVGLRKPHKNHERIVEAFAQSGASQVAKLLFTGEPSQALNQMVEQHNLQSRVEFLGVVSDELLATLYRGAVALVFPSLYEGFGLPAIEAMASGCPVITSNVTALPEIAGDSAILVDPLDSRAIGAAMNRLIEDGPTRKFYSAEGIRRAKLFNWDEVAKRVRRVFDSIG